MEYFGSALLSSTFEKGTDIIGPVHTVLPDFMASLKLSWPTQTDGEIYHILGLEESIWWKWLYYSNQSTDSMQSLSNYQMAFSTELEQIVHHL